MLGGTGSHRQVDETNQNELTRIRQPCSKFPSKEGIYRDPEARVAVHVANRLVRPAAAWVCPVWGCVEADARCVSQLMQSDFWRSCLAPKFMSLKKGAQVMLLANLDASMGLVNGARGVVVGYAKAEDPAVQATTRFVGDELLLPKTACFSPADPTLCVQTELAHTQARPALGGVLVRSPTSLLVDILWCCRYVPMVQFICLDRPMPVFPHKFSSEISGVGTSYRIQVPLKLAWALTVHKCQGMTLDYAQVALADAFAFGQACVLCRCVRAHRLKVAVMVIITLCACVCVCIVLCCLGSSSYVALSRVRDGSGLQVTTWRDACVKADAKVLQFYRNLVTE